MKRRNKIILLFSTLFGLTVAIAICFVWPRNHLEVQVHETKRSPDGKWTAVLQIEVYNSASVVNDAVYAVRLKGPTQEDRQGDLVMNVPVNYPGPEPSIDWTDDKLVITLTGHQMYQYFANPVSGIYIIVQRK